MEGFTPAHAGNTQLVYIFLGIYQVHPRSRGEYCTILSSEFWQLGSPPLTRGIHISRQILSHCYRFTPAHAGNTKGGNLFCRGIRVHPRSRGEYLYNDKSYQFLSGSPPLTRGIRVLTIFNIIATRFTPAHAGNTVQQHYHQH